MDCATGAAVVGASSVCSVASVVRALWVRATSSCVCCAGVKNMRPSGSGDFAAGDVDDGAAGEVAGLAWAIASPGAAASTQTPTSRFKTASLITHHPSRFFRLGIGAHPGGDPGQLAFRADVGLEADHAAGVQA